MKLKGKVAIITGASSGIGRAAAILFAQEGAKLVLAARGRPRLDQLASELHAHGSEAICVAGDVRDESFAKELVGTAQREWGREEVHKDWSVAVKAGKPAPCHFGYAGPFTEAYQLGNLALRVGHKIEWDALNFRVTNCQEANQYLRREYRRGWDLKEIAGSAWDVPYRRA